MHIIRTLYGKTIFCKKCRLCFILFLPYENICIIVLYVWRHIKAAFFMRRLWLAHFLISEENKMINHKPNKFISLIFAFVFFCLCSCTRQQNPITDNSPLPVPTQTAVPPPAADITVSPAVSLQPSSSAAQAADDDGEIYTYVVNIKSNKFHYSSCAAVAQMKESNKEYCRSSREDMIKSGYSPCGRCCP